MSLLYTPSVPSAPPFHLSRAAGWRQKARAEKALRAAYGSIPAMLARVAVARTTPPLHGAAGDADGAAAGGAGKVLDWAASAPVEPRRALAVQVFALSMLSHALRLRWLAPYCDLRRALNPKTPARPR